MESNAYLLGGEIVALEFDSGDEAKDDPFYVVRYTDGDQKDFDGKELSRALELYHRTTQNKGDKAVTVDDSSMSSGSDDEESYVLSPEIHVWNLSLPELYALLTLPYLNQSKKRARKNAKMKSQSSSSLKALPATEKVRNYYEPHS